MKCILCGGSATAVKEKKKARYRDEIVEVVTELFRCSSCKWLRYPTAAREHTRAVMKCKRRGFSR